MDLSLDDIIKSKKPSRGQPRGGGRGRGPNRGRTGGGGGFNNTRDGRVMKRDNGNFGAPRLPRALPDQWEHDMFEGATRGRNTGRGEMFSNTSASTGGQGPNKLLISNLDFNVTDNDIKELFCEFGELKRASINYDRSGRSVGTAEVIFVDRMSAAKAQSHYNGVPLDGRSMSIQFVGGSGTLGNVRSDGEGVPMRNRLGNRSSGGGGGARGSMMQQRNSTRGRGSSRGGGGVGRGRGGRGSKKPDVTKEQLDAEMDEYRNQVE